MGFAHCQGKPRALDAEEPENCEAIAKLGVRHAVITSVNRDELPDGGAQHFAETVSSIKEHSPNTRIELLVPDFLGDEAALDVVLAAGPHVVAHNVETIQALSTCSPKRFSNEVWTYSLKYRNTQGL